MNYSKRTDNKDFFTKQVFYWFTNACGGDVNEFANQLYAKFTVECFEYSDDYQFFNVADYMQHTVIPHKIAVYEAGLNLLKQKWFSDFVRDRFAFLENIWTHDMSKFSAIEALGYAFHNFKSKDYDINFEMAWHHHKMNNPHHPEYWLNPSRTGEPEVLPMPNIFIVEMIADWIGAGKTYGNTLEKWLPDNIYKFRWHEKTAQTVKLILQRIDIDVKIEGATLFI